MDKEPECFNIPKTLRKIAKELDGEAESVVVVAKMKYSGEIRTYGLGPDCGFDESTKLLSEGFKQVYEMSEEYDDDY